MAILTTNISSVSLTVSGTTTKSTTLSWTCPSVPAGSTINSCTLTGTATASMSKGSATIKVNGTTVSSGSNFTINLGTGNTTSSVTATAVGGNKNAKGTVTFNNLVYTVNYSEPVVTYTVTFKDWDGTVLKTQTVEQGQSATAPTNPTRNGYEFIGWDRDFSNVQADMFVMALYEAQIALKVKSNGLWANINKIYKRINNVWAEQSKNNWSNLFSSNVVYKQCTIVPTAILYSDGTLVFYNNQYATDIIYENIIELYTGWDTMLFDFDNNLIPWYSRRAEIVDVRFNNVAVNSARTLLYGCSSLTSIDLSGLDTSNVTNMMQMFQGCSSLTSIDLSGLDTSNVTNISNMFQGCSSLTSVDLSGLDTSNVTNMTQMFHTCYALTSIDLSGLDISNVTKMVRMFYGCASLKTVNLNTWSLNKILSSTSETGVGRMFEGCTNLQTVYVKDETAKTKIESSYGFPSTATVVIGSPNN